jgi:hypothetical protein
VSRKEPFTLDEHKATGLVLAQMSRIVTHLLCGLSACYPLNSRVMRAVAKADRALRELRSALEDKMFREHRDADLVTYYPGAQLDLEPTSPHARPFRPMSWLRSVR